MHHLIGPLNTIDQSYCTTHSFTVTASLSIWQKPRGLNFTKPWFGVERRKKGKWLSSPSLWAPTQGAVRLILPLQKIIKQIQEKKGEIWLSRMTTWQHKNATKNFDYTTISDRLRTVSWSNDSYPTSVVKLKQVYGILEVGHPGIWSHDTGTKINVFDIVATLAPKISDFRAQSKFW